MPPTVLAVELGLRIFDRPASHAADGMETRLQDQSKTGVLGGRSVGRAVFAAVIATVAGLFATVQQDWGPRGVPATALRISVAVIAVLAALTSVCFARRKGTPQRRAAPWMLAVTIAAFLTWYGALALETIAAGN
jgi:ABC-type branched-subunit amino acid transport system permease subunit